MKSFALPDLGEGLQEAEIVTWHVVQGDHVVADQPLVSVETEKAVVEVPAPRSGTIEKLHGEVGDIVKIGAVLVDFADETPDQGAIVGELEASPPPKEKPAKSKRTPVRARPSDAQRAQIIPSARRRASELDVDLSQVKGTGPGGVITLGDVETAARAVPAPKPEGPTPTPEGYEPLRGPRRAMAEAMARAGREIVPSTVTEDAQVGPWIAFGDVTLRLVRAIAHAANAEPALNAWFDGKARARRLHDTLDLGIAMDTPDGLFVPVLRDAGNQTGDALRAEIDRLWSAVNERSVAPDEMKGATFTLSNFGTIGGHHASLVIVPPQVAILGAGRVIANSGAQASSLLPLSLTFDHRAATGGDAARFLTAVREDLELAE